MFANVCIERAGPQPLDIRFHDRPIEDFFKYVMPYIDRWRSLDVVCTDFGFWAPFFDRLPNISAPILQNLRIHRAEPDANYRLVPQPLLSGGAPMLRTFAIFGTIIPCIVTPFQQLETLYIHNSRGRCIMDSYTNLHAMLNGLSALQTLIIHGDIFGVYDPVGIDHERLDLPSLKHIEFVSMDSVLDLAEILKHLLAPVLESVVMRASQLCDVKDDLQTIPVNRFPSVRKLTFTAGLEDTSDVEWTCLESIFPNIEKLTTGFSEVMNFASWAQDAGRWPRLQTIRVASSSWTNGLGRPIKDDIQALDFCMLLRVPIGKIMQLHWPARCYERDRYDLKKLEGLRFEVSVWQDLAEVETMDKCMEDVNAMYL